jgi:hypothetical protein
MGRDEPANFGTVAAAPASGTASKRPLRRHPAVVAALIVGALGVVAALVSGLFQLLDSDEPATAPNDPPAQLPIEDLIDRDVQVTRTDGPRPERHVVAGTFSNDVAHLGTTRTLWVATRPALGSSDDPKQGEELYWPGVPCAITDLDGGPGTPFTCEVDLGSLTDGANEEYLIWIVALDQTGLAVLTDSLDDGNHLVANPPGAEFGTVIRKTRIDG